MDAFDEDEDVTFEHLPLYQSLKEAGLSDEEIQVHKDPVQHSSTCSKWVPQQGYQLTVRSVWGFIGTLLGLKILSEDLQRLTCHYKKMAFKLILSSSLLEDEDRDSLNSLFQVYNNNSINLTVRWKFLFMFTLPCLMTYLYARVTHPDLPWQYRRLTDISAVLCLFYVLFLGTKSLILYNKQRRLKGGYQNFQQLVDSCEKLHKFTKKSLRLIQESELVARGFTLISQQSPVSRLEQSSLHNTQRQCPLLRSCVFLVCRRCMLVAKDRTTSLINQYPLESNIDGAFNYLAQVQLEEYGPCIKTEEEGEEGKAHLYTITDGFSVSSLKGIKHLCELHISELFRRLMFTLKYSGDSSIGLDSTELERLVTSIGELMDLEGQKLQRMYDSHSSVFQEQETKIPRHAPENTHPLKDTYTAVHSLDLHLQSALLRVRSLASLLETHMDQSQGDITDHTVKEAYEKLHLQVKHELHACKSCWEEGISRLEKLEKAIDNSSASSQKDPHVAEVQTEHSAPPIPLFEMGDPIIEDQVFEAYITDDPVEGYQNSWEEFITPEEKAKRKKEKEEAMRLLTELKSVISVRATEREIRENKALERTRIRNISNSGERRVLSEENVTLKNVNCIDAAEERNDRISTCEPDTEAVSENGAVKVLDETAEDNSGHKMTEKITCSVDVIGRTDTVSLSREKDTLCQENATSEIPKSDLNTSKFYSDFAEDSIDEEECSPKYKQRKVTLPEYTDSESDEETDFVKNWDDIIRSSPTDNDNNSIECDTNRYPISNKQEPLTDRLARLSGANMSFSANLAAMAAARSRDIGLSETTFGDEDEEFSTNYDNECEGTSQS